MKKYTKLFAATLTLSTLCLPVLVSADDGAEYSSKGQVQFAPSEDPTNPVDPTNPTEPIAPIDPVDPDGPNKPTAGPLSIDYASSFDFGVQKITSLNQTYYAKAQEYHTYDAEGKVTTTKKTGPNYVQVTDNRGTLSGWNLKVKQNAQFMTADEHGNKELAGSLLTLSNGHVVTAADSEKPTGQSTIKLTPGVESSVMDAEQGQGAGTYLLAWGNDDVTAGNSVKLEVPGSTTKHATKYTTTLTWSLTSIPENPA